MKEKIAVVSIIANIFLAGGKIGVGFVSGSVSILAAGLDSLTDIFSSTIGYVGIRIASKPADKKHPYGHHKFEVLTGAIITLIVLAAGLKIIYDAFRGFLRPSIIEVNYLAFGVMIFSVAANEIMARLKIHYGKKENSVSLLSDGMHSRLDVYGSLAILVGLFATKYWIYADSFLAFLIGVYVIKGAFSIGREAVDSLLDISADDDIEEKIKLIAREQNIEIDSLKTQKKGSAITAEIEINLPNNLSVKQATSTSDRLREKLTKTIRNLEYIVIQITSHEMETGFYKPEFGRSFGWQRRGQFKGEAEGAKREGLGGHCVCLKCGYKIPHQRGTPCSKIECPKCKINLSRK